MVFWLTNSWALRNLLRVKSLKAAIIADCRRKLPDWLDVLGGVLGCLWLLQMPTWLAQSGLVVRNHGCFG